MQLNHLHLMVSDTKASADFLGSYFGMRTLPGARDRLAVLSDDRGMILTLMQSRNHLYPKHFHIGFSQPSRAAVDALWQRLNEDGHAPSTPERAHAWSFYVMAPGGFLIEVLSAAESED
ncbi:VOC family protein [Sphingosinicella sp. BN140058]|nr:VOC family protein [Sphingosinicella sp. BN140058]